MTDWLLRRERDDGKATAGQLYFGTVFVAFTLERPVGMGKGPIPAGHYQLIIDKSERFNKLLPHILNVPGFDGVRIHCGNTAQDTEGCVLLGLSHDTPDEIERSRSAYAAFIWRLRAALKQGHTYLTISHT